MRRGILLVMLLAVGTAQAAEGDLSFTAAQLSKQKAIYKGKGRVMLYGPVKLTPQLKDSKDVVYMYVDDVDFGGKAVSYTHLTLPTNREV